MTFAPILHAAFERSDDSQREYAELLERSRQARHILAHGSLDGYVPLREFPCPGWIREVARISPDLLEAACDVCGFVTSFRERSFSSTPGGEW